MEREEMGKFTFTVQPDSDVPMCDSEEYHLRLICKNLWIGVLHQIIADAFFPVKMTRSTVTGTKRSIITRENIFSAREWLLEDSKDFREVCAMAGFEPDKIRRRALVWDKTGWPPRIYEVLRTRTINYKERY